MEARRTKRIYRRAMRFWGFPAQLGILQEELAELIQATSKIIRTPGANAPYRNFAAEIADVEIMLEQVRNHCDWQALNKQIDTAKHDKLLRLEKTLDDLGAE